MGLSMDGRPMLGTLSESVDANSSSVVPSPVQSLLPPLELLLAPPLISILFPSSCPRLRSSIIAPDKSMLPLALELEEDNKFGVFMDSLIKSLVIKSVEKSDTLFPSDCGECGVWEEFEWPQSLLVSMVTGHAEESRMCITYNSMQDRHTVELERMLQTGPHVRTRS